MRAVFKCSSGLLVLTGGGQQFAQRRVNRQTLRRRISRWQLIGAVQRFVEVIDRFVIGKQALSLLTSLDLIGQSARPVLPGVGMMRQQGNIPIGPRGSDRLISRNCAILR